MLTFEALLRTAKLVCQWQGGISTGGSTITMIDTAAIRSSDDFWNGGTIFILSGNNANNSAIITDFANFPPTWSFGAFGPAIVAGQSYVVARATFNRAALLAGINQALSEIGPVTQHNDTLTVLDDTNEYTLPASVYNVVRVEVDQNGSAPYSWTRSTSWEEDGGKLIFLNDSQPTSTGNKIRIYYNAPQSTVSTDSDIISDRISPERLSWTAAYYAGLQRTRQVGQDDPSLKDLVGLLSARVTEMASRFPVRNIARSNIGSGI